MELWAIVITALGGLSGLAGLVTAISTARQSTRRSDFDSLRDTVVALQDENNRLRERVRDLETENSDLRKALGLPRKNSGANALNRKKGLALHDDSA